MIRPFAVNLIRLHPEQNGVDIDPKKYMIRVRVTLTTKILQYIIYTYNAEISFKSIYFPSFCNVRFFPLYKINFSIFVCHDSESKFNISSHKIQIHHFEAPKGMTDYYRHEYRRLEYGFWIHSVRPYLNISLILTNFFPPLQSFPLNGINSINRTEIGFFRDNSTKGMISSKFKSR